MKDKNIIYRKVKKTSSSHIRIFDKHPESTLRAQPGKVE